MLISQSEADALIALEKVCVDSEPCDFPDCGQALAIPLVSLDNKEQFVLNIRRGRIDFAKCTYLNRARQVVILIRVDIGGPIHLNPDGEEIPCPHIHIYREGYGDKWAVSLPATDFEDASSMEKTLNDFLQYCNITDIPTIQWSLV